MRRTLAIAALLLLILFAAGLLLLSRAVTGDAVRTAVEQRLSVTFGQPVSIGRLGLSITPLFSISGTNVRLGKQDTEVPGITIERVVIRPRLGALLRREVIVEDIELRGMVVSVLRDAKGNWQVPPVAPSSAAADSPPTLIERARIVDGQIRVFDQIRRGEVRQTSSIDAIATTMEPGPGGFTLSPINGRIGGAAIAGTARTSARAVQLDFAAERIPDEDLPKLLGLLGAERPAFMKLGSPIAIQTSLAVDRASARLTGRGTLKAPQVLLESVRLQQLESPFTITGDRLEFSPVTFAIAQGTHKGSVTMRFDPLRWAIESRVGGMNVKEFLGTLTGTDQRLEGTGTITAALSGRVDQALLQSATGRLQLVVTNGVVRDFPLLAAIDRALKLTAQQEGDTAFERLTASFDVAGGAASTNDLVMTARDVRLHAEGRIGADRSLDMRGRAILSPERSARAIASIHELKGMRNAAGEIEVPLTIAGSLDAPRFNIDIGAILKKGALDEIKRRLRRFIRD